MLQEQKSRGEVVRLWGIGSATSWGDKRTGYETGLGSGTLCWNACTWTDFPDGSVVNNPLAYVGDMGSIFGLGRSSGEGNGNPLQNSCLGNPWTEEPGRLQYVGSQKSWTNLATKQRLALSFREVKAKRET